jgi:hypothetical protein
MPKGIVPSKAIGEYLASHDDYCDSMSQFVSPAAKVSMDAFELAGV